MQDRRRDEQKQFKADGRYEGVKVISLEVRGLRVWRQCSLFRKMKAV